MNESEILAAIVERIVEVAAPERIILFGSRATGGARPESDYDILVLKSGEYHSREMATKILRRLRDVAASVDIIVATPERANELSRAWWTVFAPAMKDGAVIYEHAA